jgi:hypothetical protein
MWESIMSELVYILTIFFFSYAVNKIIGDEIGLFIKNNLPQYSLLLTALPRWSATGLKRVLPF